MTITLSPEQEKAVRDAIRAGQFASVEEFVERAIADLGAWSEASSSICAVPPGIFEQGLGLFGSPEDSALLDEIVSNAYNERHRPSRREF